jgi:hypothetical protein
MRVESRRMQWLFVCSCCMLGKHCWLATGPQHALASKFDHMGSNHHMTTWAPIIT